MSARTHVRSQLVAALKRDLSAPNIEALGELHTQLDAAVLAAYGWLGEDGGTGRPWDCGTLGLCDLANRSQSPSPKVAKSPCRKVAAERPGATAGPANCATKSSPAS